MRRHNKTLGAFCVGAIVLAPLMVSVGAHALGDGDAEALASYKKTGEAKNCLALNRVRTTDVLDNQHILFKMRNGDLFLNTLSHSCSLLGFYESFSYRVHGSQLCSVDTITVLISGGMPGPTCGLGVFEEVEKIQTKETT